MVFLDGIKELIALLSTEELTYTSVLIAIEGRPCSGKTTLAVKLAELLHAETYHLDEFFIPVHQWPADIQPGFPFPYFRYDEFASGIRTLAEGKPFKYFSYDWKLGDISSVPSEIIPGRNPIIIEGVSTLDSSLVGYYSKKIFVVSDPNTEWNAILARDGKKFEDQWKNLYLPSVECYYQTRPWEKADVLFAGRGVFSEDQTKVLLGMERKL